MVVGGSLDEEEGWCCVYYRALKGVTVKDFYLLLRIGKTLDALVTARWLSTLYLKGGYHQVKVAKEDKAKTVFSTVTATLLQRSSRFPGSGCPRPFLGVLLKL